MPAAGPPLRILITNVGIANRTGTEIVAMDLARALAREGHSPMIWTPLLRRDLTADLSAAGIPVADDLDDLPAAPDIIHGHHHLETIAALRRFPGCNAIFVSHSGHYWFDAPPRHPRILHYVAVDDFCRERLDAAPFIPPHRISVIHNAVDLRRFHRRAPLPLKPRRALVFSNYAGPGTHLEAIEEACHRRGLPLDVAGSGSGRACAEPESLLPAYDLVFAKARCALEAMAAGCAVILCDTAGLGGIVRPENLEEMRRWNFGFRLLSQPLHPDPIGTAIDRYDPDASARVSSSIRATAGLDDAALRYLTLYRDVLQRPPEVETRDNYPVTECVQIDHQAALGMTLLDVPRSVSPGEHFIVRAVIDNRSPVALATAAPWPCLLMHRWMDSLSGEVIVEHGFRSILQPPALPGSRGEWPVRVIAPRTPGACTLRVTIVQEGWRWLDHLEPRVYACADLIVSARSR